MMKHWIAIGLVSSASHLALAMPTIDVGTHQLQPGLSHQPVAIYVSGGDPVEGLNIYAQIGNGTDDLAAPVIESIDITGAGHVFGSNNNGPVIGDAYPHEMSVSTVTLSGTVSASGKLATLYIDTTGYSSGTWSLILGNYTAQSAAEFDKSTSDFAGLPAQITDGSITIAVPEPASLAVLGLAASILVRRHRRPLQA